MGTTIVADLVVVGIGAIPNAELAAAAGLAVDSGILVDEFGRTSDPSIFAAGDACRHFNPLLGRHVRLEAWQNAQNQAIAVAKVIAGGTQPYAELPWLWTDQYGHNFQSAGSIEGCDEIVWRGESSADQWTAFYLKDKHVIGGACLNNGRDMRFIKQFARNAARISRQALADLGTDLRRAG